MMNIRRVASSAKNIALVPARLVDGVALHVAADGSRYVLMNGVPWAWNKIPAGFKTAVAHHLLDHNSRARQTLDGLVTVAAGLAVADKVAGPDVAIYRGAFEFWANNRLLTAGLTLGVPAAAELVYDGVKHKVSTAGRVVYGAALATGIALIIASPFIGHPVGSKGVSGPEKPAAVEQKPLTQQDLDAFVANTLLPQFKQGMDKMSEEQRKAFEGYVQQSVGDYFTQQIAAGGYVTGSDLEKLGQQISGQLSSLESRISAAQATPTAVPPAAAATPQPPKPTPAMPGVLEGYLNLAGKPGRPYYVVPGSFLKTVAASDGQGLASLLTNGDANLLGQFMNGNDADGEFSQLNVSGVGVTAVVQYGAAVGQRSIPLPQTSPSELSRYLQGRLTPAQLSAIQLVTN